MRTGRIAFASKLTTTTIREGTRMAEQDGRQRQRGRCPRERGRLRSRSTRCPSPSGLPTAAPTRRSSGASLSVADGEFVAIVGPTGCGKSTLLNVAAGLIAPSTGRADIFGAPLTGPQPAGRLSVPGGRAVSLEDRARKRRDRARDRRHRAARKRASGRRPGSSASGSPVSARAIRTCCRAGRGSASGWCRC